MNNKLNNQNQSKRNLSKEAVLDWIAEHEIAWKDLNMYFKDLNIVELDDIIDWISYHKLLNVDFNRAFNLSNN